MTKTDENWWPGPLAHIPSSRPWDDVSVVVAELKSFDDTPRPGERRAYTVLVPKEDIAAVSVALANLHAEITTTGPRPGSTSAGTYRPGFWVGAKDLPHTKYEPLVLAWTSHDVTVLQPDPGFLMTYGLTPRALDDGAISYDDPAGPLYDIVRVGAPSVWSSPSRTTATVTINRDHLQDYLTLRGMALVEVFYEIRWGRDDAAIDALGSDEAKDFTFSDRLLQINRDSEDKDGIIAQVWGARIIAQPNGLPITNDPLDEAGLEWPGIAGAITNERAKRLHVDDFVYVKDDVLAAYEGREDFEVFPVSGGVKFGFQWSVSYIERVGRDLLRLEAKKLYESAPTAVVQHWHKHATAPAVALLSNQPNIATRAHNVVRALLSLGDSLGALASALNLASTTPGDLIGLDRADLEYAGWWTPSSIEPITRHAPLGQTRDAFLERSKALSALIVEGLNERRLRALALAAQVPEAEIKDFKSLKLLDVLVKLAQVSKATGLPIHSNDPTLWGRLSSDGTTPAKPTDRLAALIELRNLAAHPNPKTPEKVRAALIRLGIDASSSVSGYGAATDAVYDAVVDELNIVAATISAALI